MIGGAGRLILLHQPWYKSCSSRANETFKKKKHANVERGYALEWWREEMWTGVTSFQVHRLKNWWREETELIVRGQEAAGKVIIAVLLVWFRGLYTNNKTQGIHQSRSTNLHFPCVSEKISVEVNTFLWGVECDVHCRVWWILELNILAPVAYSTSVGIIVRMSMYE